MEVLEFVSLIAVLVTVSGTIIALLFRFIPRKTAKRTAENENIKLQRRNSELIDEIMQREKAARKSLNSELNLLKKESSNEEEDDELPIPPEMLEPIAKKLNMQPQALAAFVMSPQGKKLLKQYKDLLPALPALLGGLGNGQQNNQQPQQQMF